MINKDIYYELKKRIIYLHYQPKQILNIKDLAQEFGVSPMPIREALILLEAENLVHIIPNHGIYVTEISFQELKELFEVRLFLLGLAGRFAAQRISAEELNKMKELLQKIKQVNDQKMLVQLDAEFHDLLNSSTKNQTLADMLKKLRQQIGRLWFFAKENDSYAHHIPEDFSKLIQALEERDQAQSEEILKKHALHFIEQIKSYLYSE